MQPLYVVAAIVVGVAVIGFFTGTSGPGYSSANEATPEHDEPVLADVRTAPTYSQLRVTPRGTDAPFRADLARLRDGLPTRTAEVDLTGSSKATALAERSARRAFSGAPPTIPHPVRHRAASECLACHEFGAKLGDYQAPAVPHDSFQVCTQCHPMEDPLTPWGRVSDGIADDPRDVDNAFVGLAEPTAGDRWSPISPPTVPHASHMRENCDSCHGVSGKHPMRSTHPDRQNCEQCHAPNASLEWRPGGLQ